MIFYDAAGKPESLESYINTAINGPDDTVENIVYTYTGVWKPNTAIRWMMEVTAVSNANAKNVRLRLGGISGTVYYQRDVGSATGFTIQGTIANRAATNSQVGSVIAGTTHAGVVLAWGKTTSSVDTSVPFTIVVTIEKATAGDLVTLERMYIERMQG